jgi:hypothetical protein
MATVPSYGGQQVADNPPMLRAHLSAPPIQDSGAPLKAVGGAMEKAGGDVAAIAEDMQNQFNNAVVSDGFNQLQEARFALTNDPTGGFKALQQKDALSRPDNQSLMQEYGQKFDKSVSDIAAGLKNDAQRLAFQQKAAQEKVAFDADIGKHVAVEAVKFNEGTQIAKINTASKIAAADPYNQATVAQQSQSILEGVQALNPGASEEEIKDKFANAATPMHTAILAQMLADKKTDVAQQYFDAVKETMTLPAQETFEKEMHIAVDRNKGLTVALDVRDKFKGNINAQESELDKQYRAGDITEQVHDYALGKLRSDWHQQEAQKAVYTNGLLSQVWDIHDKAVADGRTPSINDIPPNLLHSLQVQGHRERVESIMSSESTKNYDPNVEQDLVTMANGTDEQKVEFAQKNPVEWRGKVKPSISDRLVSMQNDIRTKNSAAMDASKQIEIGIKKTADQLSDLHITGKNATPGELTEFKSSLRAELVAAQAANKGVPLTPDQITQRTRALLASGTIKVPGTLWGTNDVTASTYKLLKSIPPDLLQKIQDRMARNKVMYSPTAVLTTLQEMQNPSSEAKPVYGPDVPK